MSLKCSNLGCLDNATWTLVIEASVDAADKYRPIYGTHTFCNKHKKLLEKIRPDYYKFRELWMERRKNRLHVTSILVMEDIHVLHIQSEKLLRKLIEDLRKESQLILSKCTDIAAKKGIW